MDFDILAALEDRSIEVETLADKDRMQIEYINVKDIIPARCFKSVRNFILSPAKQAAKKRKQYGHSFPIYPNA